MKFSSTVILAIAASLASAAPLNVNLEVSTKSLPDVVEVTQRVPKVDEPRLPSTELVKAVAIPKVEGVPAVPVKLPVRKRVDLPAIAVPAVVVPTVPGLPETPALPDVSKVVGLVKVPRGIAEPKVAGVPAVDTTTVTSVVPSVESVPMVPAVLPESEIKKLTKGAPLSDFTKFIERIKAKETATGAIEVVKGKATGAVAVVKGKVIEVVGNKLDPVTGLLKPLRETVDKVVNDVQSVTGPL